MYDPFQDTRTAKDLNVILGIIVTGLLVLAGFVLIQLL